MIDNDYGYASENSEFSCNLVDSGTCPTVPCVATCIFFEYQRREQ